jgi:hypothetical protein
MQPAARSSDPAGPEYHSIIPAARGGGSWRIQGVCAQFRQEFSVDPYSRRALSESLISAVKR